MMNITKENSVRKVFDRRAVYAFCAVLLVVSLTAVSIASFFVSAQNVRSDVLRLHVIANSDSPEDQAVKLTVRDEVLKAGWDVGVAWQDGRPFFAPYGIRVNLALPLSRVQEAFERLKKYVF